MDTRNRSSDRRITEILVTEIMDTKIRIAELDNAGDRRGLSLTVPSAVLAFLGRVLDFYLSSTEPGAVRGNHYHLRRREATVVLPGAAWSLHWDEGQNTPAQHRQFDGDKAILVLVSPGASHAVRNEDKTTLWLVALSSESYDPAESVTRKVV
jgi:dTDP-4-dehydrorhamnose 3,5-epimerase-like enzyme